MYRGRVASAIRGKRGQSLLIELRDALDALPVKRLIAGEFATESGEVCSLGAVGMKRQWVNLEGIDSEQHDVLAKLFNVAECLVREVEWENDEGGWNETPEQRWQRMRNWVARKINP